VSIPCHANSRAWVDTVSRQSIDEEDKLDKLDPTIRYLQKLGPKHVELIFSEAKWVFKEDAQMASRVSIR
jgi:hypothetical protein